MLPLKTEGKIIPISIDLVTLMQTILSHLGLQSHWCSTCELQCLQPRSTERNSGPELRFGFLSWVWCTLGDDFKFQVVSCCFYFPSLLHNRIPIDSWGPRLAPDQSRMTFVAGQETESSTSTGCFPGQGPSLSTVVFLGGCRIHTSKNPKSMDWDKS